MFVTQSPEKNNDYDAKERVTYPSGFRLIFQSLFGVLSCGLNVINCVLYMILYAVYHFSLKNLDISSSLKEWLTKFPLT